jgi:hypothetical protein
MTIEQDRRPLWTALEKIREAVLNRIPSKRFTRMEAEAMLENHCDLINKINRLVDLAHETHSAVRCKPGCAGCEIIAKAEAVR